MLTAINLRVSLRVLDDLNYRMKFYFFLQTILLCIQEISRLKKPVHRGSMHLRSARGGLAHILEKHQVQQQTYTDRVGVVRSPRMRSQSSCRRGVVPELRTRHRTRRTRPVEVSIHHSRTTRNPLRVSRITRRVRPRPLGVPHPYTARRSPRTLPGYEARYMGGLSTPCLQ